MTRKQLTNTRCVEKDIPGLCAHEFGMQENFPLFPPRMQNIQWQKKNTDRTIFIQRKHLPSGSRVHKFGFDQSIHEIHLCEKPLPYFAVCLIFLRP